MRPGSTPFSLSLNIQKRICLSATILFPLRLWLLEENDVSWVKKKKSWQVSFVNWLVRMKEKLYQRFSTLSKLEKVILNMKGYPLYSSSLFMENSATLSILYSSSLFIFLFFFAFHDQSEMTLLADAWCFAFCFCLFTVLFCSMPKHRNSVRRPIHKK